MSTEPVIEVEITIDSTGTPRAGFGTGLIASHNATWPERTRDYASTVELAVDWGTTTPEYRCGAAIFAQENPPELVKIGRVASTVTQQYVVEVEEVADAHLYSIGVEGEGFDEDDAQYTSDSTATKAEIQNGLVDALNAVTDKNYTAAFGALVVADQTFVAEADDETMTAANALVVANQDFTADNTTEIFTKAAHGRSTGDGPVQVSNGGGALPTGLAALTDYWFIRIDANTFYFATTLANALASTHLSISDNGTGTQTYADTTETRSVVEHGLSTGDGPVRVSNAGGALPTGLLAATDYWFIRMGVYTFKLALSLDDALAGTAIAISTDGTGTQTMSDTADTVSPSSAFTVTGNAAGDWFSLDVAVKDLSRVSIFQSHAAGTLDVDLAAILEEDDEWYCLLTLYNSHDYVKEAAAWAETNGRIYVFDANDSEAILTAFDIDAPTATDTFGELCALNYKRTMFSYHPRPAAFFAAAWMGDWLPTTPGEATAALKTLVGVETTKLNSTLRGRLEDRRASAYLRVGGRGITWESKVPNTDYEFLDVTRNIDYMKDGIAAVGYDIIAGAKIIPFTPSGIAQVAGGVLGFLTGEATDNGVLDREQAPNVIPPKFESISTADKKSRRLRRLKFNARLSGAIHAAAIEGTVVF